LEDDVEAPVSYNMNVNLVSPVSLGSTSVVSPSICVLMAPLGNTSGNPAMLKSNATTFTGKPTDTAKLDMSSNPSGSYGGTHASGKRINVLFCDSHVEDFLMSDFHGSVSNPGTGPKDLRWNK